MQTEAIIWIVCAFLLVMFAGEPDLQDALICNLTPTHCPLDEGD